MKCREAHDGVRALTPDIGDLHDDVQSWSLESGQLGRLQQLLQLRDGQQEYEAGGSATAEVGDARPNEEHLARNLGQDSAHHEGREDRRRQSDLEVHLPKRQDRLHLGWAQRPERAR